MYRASVRLPRVLISLIIFPMVAAAQQEDGPGDVPYIPTSPEVVEAMLKLGDVKKGDVVYDLGCGDGRIVVTAAQKYEARGTGVDISPERVREAEENARRAGVSGRAHFIEQNLFSTDFREATVVTLYLLPELNLRLRPKLLRDLRAGARIVSHRFDMGDWKPDKVVVVNGESVYLWIVTQRAKSQFASAGMPIPAGQSMLPGNSTGSAAPGSAREGRNRSDVPCGTLKHCPAGAMGVGGGRSLTNRYGTFPAIADPTLASLTKSGRYP